MTSNDVFIYNIPDVSTVEKNGFQMATLSIYDHIGKIYTISLKNGLNRKL